MFLIVYHNVLDGPLDPFDKRCSRTDRDLFANQMRHLAAHYRPLSLPAWLALLRSRRPDPRAVAVTFDDGYAGVHEQAFPIMAELGLPGTVFVATAFLDPTPKRSLFPFEEIEIAFRLSGMTSLDLDFLGGLKLAAAGLAERISAMKKVKRKLKTLPEAARREAHQILLDRLGVSEADCRAYAGSRAKYRLLNRAQMEEMMAWGWSLGAHSRTHRTLSRLEPAEMAAEIEGSREDLGREFGPQNFAFAYPYGDPEHIGPLAPALVKKAGFIAGLTASPGLNRPGADPFRLRRGEWHQFILSSGWDR